MSRKAAERAAKLFANAVEQFEQGRHAQAQELCKQALRHAPGHPDALHLLGVLALQSGQHAAAIELLQRVVAIRPDDPQAWFDLGGSLHELARFEEAEQAFRSGIARNPAFAPAYIGLAITLDDMRRHAEAEAMCREVLARDPTQAEAWPVLGKALLGQARWADALACFERAAREFPRRSDALGDLGDAYMRAGRMQDAMAAFERASALGTVSPIVRIFKAQALFSLGRITEGAAEYTARHELPAYATRHPDRRLATELPADMAGQAVCLIGEQGMGDEIFFLRYAPLLQARGCRLSYYGDPRLTGILGRSPALEHAQPNSGAYAASDQTVVIGDLPHLLAPPELPPPLALEPLPDHLAACGTRLRELGPPPYVGLTWRAGTGSQDQRGRYWLLFKEIPLARLAAPLRGVRGTLVSLQRGPRAGETESLSELAGRKVHDLSAANDDLEQMLAVLALIDDYIGVSNTNMHLRAGVGRYARVLVPWPAEWRWMAAGAASPWFPGFRVYRQALNGSWDTALAGLQADLAGLSA